MDKRFEAMVSRIHDFEIKVVEVQLEQRKMELTDVENRLQALKSNDSSARKLAQDILNHWQKLEGV